MGNSGKVFFKVQFLNIILVGLLLNQGIPTAIAKEKLKNSNRNKVYFQYPFTRTEIEELRHQINILESVRDLDEILVSVRDHIRPTDLLEKKVVGETGSGLLIRQGIEAAEKLSAEIVSMPKWLKSASEKAKLAKQIAAAADLPTRFARAVKRGKTSSGAEKLRDLAEITKDMKEVLNFAFSVNPVIGAYLKVVTKAIENIAESTAKIEAATARTNRVIAEERARALGQTPQNADAEDHPLDEAIDVARERLYDLEGEVLKKAHREVIDAEKSCAVDKGTTPEAMKKLRLEFNGLTRLIPRLEIEIKAIPNNIVALKSEILTDREIYLKAVYKHRKLKTPAARAAALPNTIDALKVDRNGIKEQLAKLQQKASGSTSKLNAKLQRAKKLHKQKKVILEEFEKCVACDLSNAKFADVTYLSSHYSHYGKVASRKPKFFGPIQYRGKSDSPFFNIRFKWYYLEDFDDGKANQKGLVSQGRTGSSFGKDLIDSVDSGGDSWWGSGSLTFEFSEKQLGKFPTHVGMVWTDGGGGVTIEVWGPCGLIGKYGPHGGFADGDNLGGTDEDRFFGVTSSGGITKVRISNSPGGIEVDHVQYGLEFSDAQK